MDVLKDAINRYDAKMKMPQYQAYRDNPRLAEALMADCINEANLSRRCHIAYDEKHRIKQS